MAFYDGRRWFCCGCKSWHPLSRYIEGETRRGAWCAHSIAFAVAAGRNDAPRADFDHLQRAERIRNREARNAE